MSAPHFDAAVAAFTAAPGDRLAPGITDFIDLFEPDAIIDVPFDGDGSVAPIHGRAALQTMADALRGILPFEGMSMHHLHETTKVDTAPLHRRDHPARRTDPAPARVRRPVPPLCTGVRAPSMSRVAVA